MVTIFCIICMLICLAFEGDKVDEALHILAVLGVSSALVEFILIPAFHSG